jgi:Helix-turn-helix domain
MNSSDHPTGGEDRMERNFDEELESLRELVRRETDRRDMELPLKAGENATSAGFIRTLESMGRRICPEKPLCAKTVRKLIRLHGLPARRHQMGWLVRGRDLEEWMDRTFTDEEGS